MSSTTIDVNHGGNASYHQGLQSFRMEDGRLLLLWREGWGTLNGRFASASGEPMGAEFTLTTSGDRLQVDGLSGGRVLLTWVSGVSLHGMILAPDATAPGDTITLLASGGRTGLRDVSPVGDGFYMTPGNIRAYDSDNIWHVHRFDASGALTDQTFWSNSFFSEITGVPTEGRARAPFSSGLGFFDNGMYVEGWSSGDLGIIKARIYTVDPVAGTSRLVGAHTMNTFAQNPDARLATPIGPNAVLLVWVDTGEGSNPDEEDDTGGATDPALYARVVTAAGPASPAELRLGSIIEYPQHVEVKATLLEDGRIAVMWIDPGQQQLSVRILGQSGQALTDELAFGAPGTVPWGDSGQTFGATLVDGQVVVYWGVDHPEWAQAIGADQPVALRLQDPYSVTVQGGTDGRLLIFASQQNEDQDGTYSRDLVMTAVETPGIDPPAPDPVLYRPNSYDLEYMAKQIAYFRGYGDLPQGYVAGAAFTTDRGFVAVPVRSPTGEPVLAFRGTSSLQDVLTDLDPEGVGFTQARAAWDMPVGIRSWLAANPGAHLTGHSLGGAQAQLIAAWATEAGIPVGQVATFNAPGIGYRQADKFRPDLAQGVTHFIASGDIVSMVGERYLPGEVNLFNFTTADLMRPGVFSALPAALGHVVNAHVGHWAQPDMWTIRDASGAIRYDQYGASDNWRSVNDSLTDRHLSNPGFSYHTAGNSLDAEFFAFQLSVAMLGFPRVAAALGVRGTAEALRKAGGFATMLAEGAIELTVDTIATVAAGLRAIASWSYEATAAINSWGATVWEGLARLNARAMDAFIDAPVVAATAMANWGADVWAALVGWSAEAWDGVSTWYDETWADSVNWSASRFVALGSAGAEVGNRLLGLGQRLADTVGNLHNTVLDTVEAINWARLNPLVPVREATGGAASTAIPAVLVAGPAGATLTSTGAGSLFMVGPGADVLTMARGGNTVFGTAATLNRDVISGFGTDDRIILLDTRLSPSQMQVQRGSAILNLDTNGDGRMDTVIRLEGAYEPEFFHLAQENGNTVIAYAPSEMAGDDTDNLLPGTPRNDRMRGQGGNDRLLGEGGNDTLYGGDGTDTLIGGAGDDLIFGGDSTADLRDVIYGGDGNDTAYGGAGNDEIRGDAGNDLLFGDTGADTLIGGTGNDTLNGGSLGDVLFGGDGDDFLNGGFGFDRLNGGAGADTFFHLGVADHGSDWIQDYNAAEGDVLQFGNAGATRAQFQINIANTPNAGAADVAEAFVIYRPTGQIIWALVDGAGQDSINLRIGGEVFDLMG